MVRFFHALVAVVLAMYTITFADLGGGADLCEPPSRPAASRRHAVVTLCVPFFLWTQLRLKYKPKCVFNLRVAGTLVRLVQC